MFVETSNEGCKHSGNHMKHINILCGQDKEILMLKQAVSTVTILFFKSVKIHKALHPLSTYPIVVR